MLSLYLVHYFYFVLSFVLRCDFAWSIFISSVLFVCLWGGVHLCFVVRRIEKILQCDLAVEL